MERALELWTASPTLRGLVAGTLLLAVALVAARGLPRVSAALRHQLVAAGLAALALVPLGAGLAPAREWPVLPVRTSWPPAELTPPPAAGVEHGPVPAATSSALTFTASSEQAQRQLGWPYALIAAWLVGVGAVLARIARAQEALRALARAAEPVEGPWLRAVVAAQAGALGIRRSIALVTHPTLPTAATWGWRRPVLCLPRAVRGWSADRRRAVVLHELAHVRRGDVVQQLACELLCAGLWFHPLVWVARRELLCLREWAADDQVLRAGARPSSYARVLLDLSRRHPGAPPLLAASLARAGRLAGLERRVRAVLEPAIPRTRATRLGAVLSVLAVGLPGGALATLVPVRRPLQPVPQPPSPDLEAFEPALEPAEPPVPEPLPSVASALPAATPAALVAAPTVVPDLAPAGAPALAVIVAVAVMSEPAAMPEPAATPPEREVAPVPEAGGSAPSVPGAPAVPLVLARGSTTLVPRPRGRERGSEQRHMDYLLATYSFRYGTRDDDRRTHNNWDIQVTEPRSPGTPPHFHVNMVTDDRSGLADLGPMALSEAWPGGAAVDYSDRACLPVVLGHTYLVHTRDRRGSCWARLRVTAVGPEAVALRWELLSATDPGP